MVDESNDPVQEVNDAAVDVENGERGKPGTGSKKKAPAVERPYPRRTLEDALRVPTALREKNGGKPWPPASVATALDLGMSGNFFYITSASRSFGLTEGTRDAQSISLTDLGTKAVYPKSPEESKEALLEAFFNVPLFKAVVEHYGGSNLPEARFVENTLQTEFNLDPRVHDEFLKLFGKNCRFVGIGAEWDGSLAPAVDDSQTDADRVTPVRKPAAAKSGEGLVCFVAMPFVERTDDYATGFFTEVFASLFKPAIEAAGFEARTAKRQGSDVIQATIINDLLDADLVLADLTEHNPNVLFELGLRMNSEKPIALVRATGTNPIFDVDHMLRVESYNPNMWPSTVEKDVPRLTAHIQEAWSRRDSEQTYISILRRQAT